MTGDTGPGERLLTKLHELPPERLAEVEGLVDALLERAAAGVDSAADAVVLGVAVARGGRPRSGRDHPAARR